MKIAGVHKVTLLDFPEHLAATVFLAGCNLNCGYCYNRWMLAEAATPEALTPAAFLAWLATRHGRLDGVCVSGGEPLMHGALAPFLREIAALGFAIKLDTNGTYPAALAALLVEGLLAYVAMDLKAPFDARCAQVVGGAVDLDALHHSMATLRAWGGAYEFRTTVGPLLDETALEEIASILQPGEAWWLQPYRRVDAPEGAPVPPAALGEEALRAIVARLAARTPGVRLRA